jgi:hypothetical protein
MSQIPSPKPASAATNFSATGRSLSSAKASSASDPHQNSAPFLSGSTESFLTDDAAKAKISQCHAQQRPTRSQTSRASENDGLAQTRNRWQAEKAKGQWRPEFIRELLKGLK